MGINDVTITGVGWGATLPQEDGDGNHALRFNDSTSVGIEILLYVLVGGLALGI